MTYIGDFSLNLPYFRSVTKRILLLYVRHNPVQMINFYTVIDCQLLLHFTQDRQGNGFKKINCNILNYDCHGNRKKTSGKMSVEANT